MNLAKYLLNAATDYGRRPITAECLQTAAVEARDAWRELTCNLNEALERVREWTGVSAQL